MAASGTGAHLAEGAPRRGDEEPAAEEEAAVAKGRGGAARASSRLRLLRQVPPMILYTLRAFNDLYQIANLSRTAESSNGRSIGGK